MENQTPSALTAGMAPSEEQPLPLETVLGALECPLWQVDGGFRIRYANRSALDLFHLSSKEMNGRLWWEVVHGFPEPLLDCPLIRASRSRRREYKEIQVGDRWFRATVNPVLDPSGVPSEYVLVLNDITDRKKAEKGLQESVKQLRAIIDAATESVFLLDREGFVVMANPVTAERLNTDLETLKRKPIYDFFTPDVASHRREQAKKVMDTGKPLQFQDERFGRTLLNSVFPVFDDNRQVSHLAIFGADITERKRLEKVVRDRGRIYQSIFKNNHAVMLVIDPESGRIRDANPAARKYYGYNLKTLRTMNISQINTLSREEIRGEMAMAKAEERNYFVFHHRLATGEIRPVEVYSGPVRIKGRELLYSIIHDISERRKAEKERELLIRELREALSEIKTLSGLLPICASCKKIRDDQGYWQQIESYIRDRSDIEFSHGICPDCVRKLYPELNSDPDPDPNP